LRYVSNDIFAIASRAIEKGLKIYIEYIPKKTNILQVMEAFVMAIHSDHLLVGSGKEGDIKRLNFDRIYRIGIEERV